MLCLVNYDYFHNNELAPFHQKQFLEGFSLYSKFHPYNKVGGEKYTSQFDLLKNHHDFFNMDEIMAQTYNGNQNKIPFDYV